jgi:YesN/AraC family two-component response regulator
MADKPSSVAFSVLIVEDDSAVCFSISRIIAKEFPVSTVYAAENGKEGLELFKKHAADIVITDINMPLMDGIEMAGEIKSIKNNTKFIVVSGYCDKEHLDRLSEIGFVDYIVKPVDFNKLFAAIEKCREELVK